MIHCTRNAGTVQNRGSAFICVVKCVETKMRKAEMLANRAFSDRYKKNEIRYRRITKRGGKHPV